MGNTTSVSYRFTSNEHLNSYFTQLNFTGRLGTMQDVLRGVIKSLPKIYDRAFLQI